jgi:hypothetical protein
MMALGLVGERTGNDKSKGKADPCGMTTRKANATQQRLHWQITFGMQEEDNRGDNNSCG